MMVSIIGVCASDYQYDINELKVILANTDESDMTGCCSVMLQLEGNDSMFSFRRDASFSADIYIINTTDWHGHKAIKQYKTDGGYFCQAVVTDDGWLIGFGGVDDGIDNERIENITAEMINDNNTISEDILTKVQEIKASYGLGHILIKAPNGNYGLATATTHQSGHLKPGDYVSLPNRYQFLRTGTIDLNTSDKVTTMVNLAASDMFGITRRDITTFHFHNATNDTFEGNITDIYISNDDGSMLGMSTGGLVDDVYFNGSTVINGSKIPIAPKYSKIGSVAFEPDHNDTSLLGDYNFYNLIKLKVFIIFLAIVVLSSIVIVRHIRFR
ncbi:MAG: hypothetical protein ACSW71_03255 [Methanobrevibacter sp.]